MLVLMLGLVLMIMIMIVLILMLMLLLWLGLELVSSKRGMILRLKPYSNDFKRLSQYHELTIYCVPVWNNVGSTLSKDLTS